MLRPAERHFKRLSFVTSVLTALFLLGVIAPRGAYAQTDLATFFSPEQLAALEQLVTIAETSSPAVIEAQVALDVAASQLELGTRLTDSLTVTVGTGLRGDIYGQIEPTYSIVAGVDIMGLVKIEDRTPVVRAQLAASKAENRARVAAAFVGYVVAREAAEAAAQTVDSTDAAFQVVKARVEIGEATISDQLAAQSAVSSAALGLLQANSNVIITLEQLAATVGQSPEATLAVVNGVELTGSTP